MNKRTWLHVLLDADFWISPLPAKHSILRALLLFKNTLKEDKMCFRHSKHLIYMICLGFFSPVKKPTLVCISYHCNQITSYFRLFSVFPFVLLLKHLNQIKLKISQNTCEWSEILLYLSIEVNICKVTFHRSAHAGP